MPITLREPRADDAQALYDLLARNRTYFGTGEPLRTEPRSTSRRTQLHSGRRSPNPLGGSRLRRAQQLVGMHGGEIVEEFFDIGTSRSLPWKRRPQANRLLDKLAQPGRGFEAVAIGEPQRAFYGNQFGLTFPIFTHYGVQLWVPEVGGPS